MDRFIARQNITHCIEQLKTETDPAKRKTLKQILAEETTKLEIIDNNTKHIGDSTAE